MLRAIRLRLRLSRAILQGGAGGDSAKMRGINPCGALHE